MLGVWYIPYITHPTDGVYRKTSDRGVPFEDLIALWYNLCKPDQPLLGYFHSESPYLYGRRVRKEQQQVLNTKEPVGFIVFIARKT